MASRPFQKICLLFCKRGYSFETGFISRQGIYESSCIPRRTIEQNILRLQLHTTQLQPCFPDALNALALPGGKLIFAATPIGCIIYYTLQAKSRAKGYPFRSPRLQGGTLALARGSQRLFVDRSRFHWLRVAPCKLS